MRRGFTLFEVLVVVVVLGILAAVVVPQFTHASTESKGTALAQSLKTIANAVDQYHARHGAYPPDVGPNFFPAGLAPFMTAEQFLNPQASAGAAFDWDNWGTTMSVTVHGLNSSRPLPSNDVLLITDRLIDDGILNTGRFRSEGGRMRYMLVP